MSYTKELLIGNQSGTYGQRVTPQRVAGLPWIRSLQDPAAAGYKYEAPHSACYATRPAAAPDSPQDVRLSMRDSIFKP